MGQTTLTKVVPDGTTRDQMAPPTTSYLARTTSYSDILAGYVAVICRLSETPTLSAAALAYRA